MKNAEQLRDELANVFNQLKNGAIKHQDAAELANLGGKMIATAKVQLEYCALRGEKPDIPWLKQSEQGA